MPKWKPRPPDHAYREFLKTDEARQIMDADWLSKVLRKHRATVQGVFDLKYFAIDHPEDFQVITPEEVELGVHSTTDMWLKYQASDWHWDHMKRQPGYIPQRNLDRSLYDPTRRRPVRHFEPSRPANPLPPHNGDFTAFMLSPESMKVLECAQVRMIAEYLRDLPGWGRFDRGVPVPEEENVAALRSWFPADLTEQEVSDWHKAVETVWKPYKRWVNGLHYGRRFRE